jgi:hypothetical protein
MYTEDPMLHILINLAQVHELISYYGVQDIYPINDWKLLYKVLIKAQEIIRWKQLHYGTYAMEWDQCQQRFVLDTTRKEVMGEPQWIRALTRNMEISKDKVEDCT